MKETLKELLISTGNLFEISHYGSYEEYEEFLKSEHEFYDSLNFLALTELIKIIGDYEEDNYMGGLENYEISLYDNKHGMIIRRITNMLYKYFNNCQEVFVPNQMIKINSKDFLVMRNIEGSLNELATKLFANFDIKFLYFMLREEEISNERKGLMIANMMFTNPHVGEKIMAPRINFELFIKNEDFLYNNLWDNIKEIYNRILDKSCDYVIDKTITLMLSKVDVNNKENTLIRKCYLRALFNFLNKEELEKINYDYYNGNYDVDNDFGYKCISDAFKSINKDKELINKIKTK